MDILASSAEQGAGLPLSPEDQFIRSTSRKQRKDRGQFFTPAAYANIMVDWIAAGSPRSILDPATGTGLLIDACQRRNVGRSFTGYDVDPKALELAKCRLAATDLRHRDFLSGEWDERFDAIVANPPYIIHRDHKLDRDIVDDIAHRSEQRLSRQSNLFVYFVIKICEQLAQGGRAAIIIPAEWMAANYGQPLKAYLLDKGLLRGLVTVDLAGHAFSDNMATASILLIEKAIEPPQAVQSYYVPDGAKLASLTALEQNPAVVRQSLSVNLLQSQKKWDIWLRRSSAPRTKGSIRLGELVTTKRGIATGANRFFLLSQLEADHHGLDPARMDSCVGKTAQVAGISFTDADFEQRAAAGDACFLFNPTGDLTPAEVNYIERGATLDIPLRHGPRTKAIWYAAETREPAPIWASTFGRGRMRFIHNAAGVKTLTCFHNIYPKNLDDIQAQALTALLNSNAMQDAIVAHVRRFTNGLMKLEPRDILDIYVPDIRLLPHKLVTELAAWLNAIPLNEQRRDEAALDRLTILVSEFFEDSPCRP